MHAYVVKLFFAPILVGEHEFAFDVAPHRERMRVVDEDRIFSAFRLGLPARQCEKRFQLYFLRFRNAVRKLHDRVFLRALNTRAGQYIVKFAEHQIFFGAAKCGIIELRVRISAKTGLVESIEAGGTQYLEESFSLQVIENYCDPWGFHYDDYQKDLGAFRLLNEQESAAFAAVAKERLSPVRVIEDGEVRTVAESLFGYRSSRAAVRYILPKKGTVVRVQIDLYNNEKDIKLKMRVRTALKDACLKGRTAFGMNVLPQSGGEVVAQDYVVTADAERAVSAIHFGTYGLSARENELNFTLLNSSAYCAHPIDDRVIMMTDRFGARIDQGERHFEFE